MSSALKGIAFITVRMNDIDETIAFYTGLGLTKTFELEERTDVTFACKDEEYTELLCSMHAPAPQPGNTGVRIKLQDGLDLDEWRRTLQARGVEFVTPEVVETDWVYEVKLKDPAGNIITVYK